MSYECKQAIYRGEIWTASRLKNQDGDYFQDMRLSMKKESQGHAFYCPECGENLILCAGNIREPYFRHYDGSECVLAQNDRAARYYAMLACMEDLVKRSFPEGKITHYGLISHRMRSQLLVETNNAVYALNYVSNSVNLNWLAEKMEKLEECGVVPVWFTIQKENKRNIPTTVEYAVSKYQPVLKAIQPNEGLLSLKEYDKSGNRLLLCETYCLEDMVLSEDGEFFCDFYIKRERLQKKEKEREKLGETVAAYFEKQLFNSSDTFDRKIVLSDTDVENAVLHLKDTADDIPQNAVYMRSLEEFWVPMKLSGEPEIRKRASNIRNAFLYFADMKIVKQGILNSDEFIRKVLYIVKQKRQAVEWILATKNGQ